MPYKDKEKQKEKNKEYQRKHYSKNKSYYKNKAQEREENLREEFNELKKTLKCETCGEDHPATLDFHHLNPLEKEIGIGRAVANGWGKDRLKQEIEKCIVLCSNCHRKLHYDINVG